jgi:electron transfer flavoprotein alpha subunit
VVESEWLRSYTADGYSAALKQAIGQIQPGLFLLTHTYEVRDFAPKLAASLQRALIGDCIGYKLEGGSPVFTRQIFQGKLSADVVPVGDAPHIVSFQIGSFRGDETEAGAAEVVQLVVNLDADLIRQQPEERFKEAKAAVDLTQAPLIVSVGRGIKEAKNIEIVKKLADALGAELAASRPICDNEWLPMDRQIGSSGQTVSPKLYPRCRDFGSHPAPRGHEGIEKLSLRSIRMLRHQFSRSRTTALSGTCSRSCRHSPRRRKN